MKNVYDQAPIDRYSAGHFAVGFCYGLARLPWWAALGLAVGWEVLENQIKDTAPQLFPRPIDDTPLNAALDIVFLMSGWASTRLLPPDPLAEHFAARRRAGTL